MGFGDLLKHCVLLPALGAATITSIFYFWEKISKKRLLPYEARFLGIESIRCRNCVHSKKACSKHCAYATLSWMLDLIDSAKTSLDVCMYLITYKEFSDAIIRARDRGCYVRVVTMRETEDTGSMVLQIRRAGILVRTMDLPPSELMHMKMVTMDHKVVLFGSINYTVSGFSGNAEEIICIRNPKLTNEFVTWFHVIWEDFNYVDDTLNNMRLFHKEVIEEMFGSASL